MSNPTPEEIEKIRIKTIELKNWEDEDDLFNHLIQAGYDHALSKLASTPDEGMVLTDGEKAKVYHDTGVEYMLQCESNGYKNVPVNDYVRRLINAYIRENLCKAQLAKVLPIISAKEKEAVSKLAGVYDAYIKLLTAELNEIVPMATECGWKSNRYDEGVKCRIDIDIVKHSYGILGEKEVEALKEKGE